MRKNTYLLAKIAADTAKNERNVAENLPAAEFAGRLENGARSSAWAAAPWTKHDSTGWWVNFQLAYLPL